MCSGGPRSAPAMLAPEIFSGRAVCATFFCALSAGAFGAPAALSTAPSTAPPAARHLAPVRFMLTFDDGPSGAGAGNPTEIILDTLAANPVQPGIKAIFFVQTRSSDGGATARGKALLAREQAQGHLIELHDGSSWGHRNHRNLDEAELEKSLADGIADLAPVTGRPVTLMRPPYWAFDQRTLKAYERHHLAVLLTDISANDGKDWGFKASPRRFLHMDREMEHLRQRYEAGEISEVEDAAPVVVTFHDTNTYTAAHMQEYLEMIVAAARRAGVPLAEPPFYADAAALEKVALVRSHYFLSRSDMVPWWWRWILW